MLDTNRISIEKTLLISNISMVDCKLNDDLFSSEDSNELSLSYFFLKPFKDKILYSIDDEDFFDKVSEFFDRKITLENFSQSLAQKLFESDETEVLILEIKGLVFEDEVLDALGFFKIDQKERFVTLTASEGKSSLQAKQGLSFGKLTRGTLIFNTERDHGYKALCIDSSSKNESQIWREQVMGLKRRKDDFYKTQQVLQVYREFVEQQLDAPAEQVAQIKAKAKDYFSQSQTFDKQEFEQHVFEEPKMVEAFESFAQNLEQERQIFIEPEFEIAEKAIKQDKKTFRSVIKLDKNFHVYVHANPNLLEKGHDPERNMNFYRLFFKNEESK
jgi:hypothetical protein